VVADEPAGEGGERSAPRSSLTGATSCSRWPRWPCRSAVPAPPRPDRRVAPARRGAMLTERDSRLSRCRADVRLGYAWRASARDARRPADVASTDIRRGSGPDERGIACRTSPTRATPRCEPGFSPFMRAMSVKCLWGGHLSVASAGPLGHHRSAPLLRCCAGPSPSMMCGRDHGRLLTAGRCPDQRADLDRQPAGAQHLPDSGSRLVRPHGLHPGAQARGGPGGGEHETAQPDAPASGKHDLSGRPAGRGAGGRGLVPASTGYPLGLDRPDRHVLSMPCEWECRWGTRSRAPLGFCPKTVSGAQLMRLMSASR
jgi:hypothetical protein